MDKELKQLAQHALLESFYKDFCSLVNGYVAKATDFDQQLFETQLQEKANVFSRNERTYNGLFKAMLITRDENNQAVKVHESFSTAFAEPNAKFLRINGFTRFTRVNGEWRYIDEWRCLFEDVRRYF
jgi:uncharacterized protein YchJ